MEDKKYFGYMRVSSREQNEDRQRVALLEMGVPEENIYMDKMSGKNFDRPQYKKMLRKLNGNTVLFIKSIDRLGRNYADLNEQWRIITKEKRADIVVIDMPLLDTRREKNLLGTFISDIVLALLSYVAENERLNIRQRQAEGIAAAKARGVKFGRPPKPLPDNFYEVHKAWKNKKLTLKEAAKACNMAEAQFPDKAKKFGRIRFRGSIINWKVYFFDLPFKPNWTSIIITEFVKKAIKNDEFCTIDICLTWDAEKVHFFHDEHL